MIVALLGLVTSLFAYLLAFPKPHQRRFDIYLALLAYHLIATVAYWLLSFESAMDAFTYYRDPFNFIEKDPLESGTYFIVHVTQAMRNTLGGSFLDHFLFFQCFGMIGLALMIRIFWEIAESLEVTVPPIAYLLLFLPGLHFWSVAIGKDGPMVMAVALSIWAVMKLPRRAVWFVVALAVMALIRPHVAAIALLALGVSLALGKQLTLVTKFALAPFALAALVFMALRVQERFGVADFESFGTLVEHQQGLSDRFGSGTDLSALPFPLKLFSLLFRPLWIDGRGFTHLAASAENTILLLVFGYLIVQWRTLWKLARNVGYVVYAVAFASVLIPLLAMVNYNIGLGQRQKMMALPAILVLCVTVHMYRRYMAGAAAAAEQARLAAAEQARVAAAEQARTAAAIGGPAAHAG